MDSNLPAPEPGPPAEEPGSAAPDPDVPPPTAAPVPAPTPTAVPVPPPPPSLGPPKRNRTAALSFAISLASLATCPFGLVAAPVGLILGYRAQRQIAVTGEAGADLARVGRIIGWVGTSILAFVILFYGGAALIALATD